MLVNLLNSNSDGTFGLKSHFRWNSESGEFQTWKNLMTNKQMEEDNILWKINSGNSSSWWDNWLGIGSLSTHRTLPSRPNNATIYHFLYHPYWKATTSGIFSCSSSWVVVRVTNHTTLIDRRTWQMHVPLKFSFTL
ncbi:hypothetical protein H5410_031146 [Solanum commersonii]|uniref:Uncharacterized protein n=1 Tax=Solanum commersonii TaxID=4109 RepID=A0A9J5YJE5_SOLCO|nr:hypothetical protein H5410_031146 [Solanum commersonii]